MFFDTFFQIICQRIFHWIKLHFSRKNFRWKHPLIIHSVKNVVLFSIWKKIDWQLKSSAIENSKDRKILASKQFFELDWVFWSWNLQTFEVLSETRTLNLCGATYTQPTHTHTSTHTHIHTYILPYANHSSRSAHKLDRAFGKFYVKEPNVQLIIFLTYIDDMSGN